jgi:integration host factor subunit beta
MTKAELIEEVSKVVEMTRKDSEAIVETIFDSIVNSLHKGDKIEIRGFGSFRTRQRQPRVGRNPKTGSRVEVPSKRIPFFKPSKELRDLVNGGHDSAEEEIDSTEVDGLTSSEKDAVNVKPVGS